MEKKAKSKPMKAILEHLKCEDIEIIMFTEEIIFK